jgi:hypothetical protein
MILPEEKDEQGRRKEESLDSSFLLPPSSF